MDPMRSRPYLDKISNSAHVPHSPGGHEFNSVTNFPSLKHTGIKSQFEKPEMPITDPEGKLTMQYRVKVLTTMRPLLHGDSNLKSQELVFKRGHKQFLDQVLQDMEAKKKSQGERRMRHWISSKSKLGFSSTFSGFDSAALSVLNTDLPFNPDIGSEAHAAPAVHSPNNKSVRFTASTAGPSSPSRNLISSSSARSHKAKPQANRMQLFEYLLDRVEPPTPASGVRRYGSISAPCVDD